VNQVSSAWNVVARAFAALADLHWATAAEIGTAVATLGLVAVAFVQLRRFNRQVRADFTYKVYSDLRQWLRLHPDARAWIDDPDGTPLDNDHYDEWNMDEFLTYFEAVWSLRLKRLVDRDMVYDLLSDDLITAYEANNLEIEKIIRDMRSEPGCSDVFIGVEKLYREMKHMTERKNPNPRKRAMARHPRGPKVK